MSIFTATAKRQAKEKRRELKRANREARRIARYGRGGVVFATKYRCSYNRRILLLTRLRGKK